MGKNLDAETICPETTLCLTISATPARADIYQELPIYSRIRKGIYKRIKEKRKKNIINNHITAKPGTQESRTGAAVQQSYSLMYFIVKVQETSPS